MQETSSTSFGEGEEILERGKAPLLPTLPLPLNKGKGIQGIGLINYILPARFSYPGNLASQSQPTKTNTTQAEPADISTRPTTQITPIVLLHLIFGRTFRLDNL